MSDPARPSVVVTGAGGQLGRAVVEVAEGRGLRAVGADHASCDISDRAAVDALLERAEAAGPVAAVVHCAAWTDVDGCEGDPDKAQRINGEAVELVAEAAKRHHARLVHVSTDFVFDGERSDGAGYREADPVGPVSEYGKSKALGEMMALAHGGVVVRTAWVFGPGGRNFPAAILNRARTVGELKVVDDQTGCPTYTPDLAAALLDVALSPGASGIYHATNAGSCTWFDFACAICKGAGLAEVPVARMSSSELERPAKRPSWSVLDPGRLPALRRREMPSWQDALGRYLAAEGAGGRG